MTERNTKPGGSRLMTRSTLKRLQAERNRLLQTTEGEGETGFQLAHDNPSILQQKYARDERLGTIGDLSYIEIIAPQRKTDEVRIGNQVLIVYEDGEIESVFLLGPDDVTYCEGQEVVVSYVSPLGRALIGKRPGDQVDFSTDGRNFQVQVRDIFPGDFEENSFFPLTEEHE